MEHIQKKSDIVSIIIVHYLATSATMRLLRTIEKKSTFEVILVDNGPDFTLKEAIQKQFPWVIYVSKRINLGYAQAINLGIEHAHGQWFMLLNNDVQTNAATIDALVKKTKAVDGLVSVPRLEDKNGAAANTVGYFDAWWKHPVNALFVRPRVIDQNKFNKPTRIDFATAGAMLINKQVNETVGPWDNRFFMYFEDMDYCLRLKKNQISLWYFPDIVMRHEKSLTANQDRKQKNVNYHTSLNTYLLKHRGAIVAMMNRFFHALR
ncbi:glycosyltransferase family 2 protein [Candidatus Woesebacteria bacterium]|nr:glycosyltransferase family 2 protein [Candidatus Woesebacteria bacterium]